MKQVFLSTTTEFKEIDSLESVDEAALRRFMGGERPQGDPYADGAHGART